jgi:SAM-dependent methyltransferase
MSTNPNGTSGKPDWSRLAESFPMGRPGYPERLFDRLLREFGIGVPGQVLLDVGTGTGALAREFAKRGCRVTAIDPCPEMLAIAKRLDPGRSRGAARYLHARAEGTGLPSACFDVAVAGQCWFWLDAPAAAKEMRRVLIPETGPLVVSSFVWLATPGNVADATDRVWDRFDPLPKPWREPASGAIFPGWLRDLDLAGFRNLESFSFDHPVSFATHESWIERLRTSPIGARLSAQDFAEFARDVCEALRHFPVKLAVPHRIFAVVGRAM